MPSSGGSSMSAGAEFQFWYLALKFADAFFDNNMTVLPEAQAVPICDPTSKNKLELVSVDDIIVLKPNERFFYSLKYRAPSQIDWSFSDLSSQGVLDQFKDQFEKNPAEKLILVTQSPSIIFDEIFQRAKEATSREDLEIRLNRKDNKYINEWDKVLKKFGYSDLELIKFANQVSIEVLPLNQIKELINQKFSGHINNYLVAGDCLFSFAPEAAKWKKTITQNHIIDLLESKGIKRKSHLQANNIIEKLNHASIDLDDCPDKFANINGSHIERNEVQKLFDWIKAPLKPNKPPIAILAGNSGYGKTVILKDLLNLLQNEKIPVLGLKADKLAFDSLNELLTELNFEDDIDKLFSALSDNFENVVLIIDQIDALSQNLSSNRKPLNTYNRLIKRLSKIRNIKIVIACRIYDLNYDPGLQQYQGKEEILVQPLQRDQIKIVLEKLGLNTENLSAKLFELLEVPLHLDIFCRVYRPEININSILTLHDLYEALWNQKINHIPDPDNIQREKVLELIQKITNKMSEEQKINLPKNYFELDYFKEIEYLCSQFILIKNNNIQFFHQSFFDFCFAKFYLKNHGSLLTNIINGNQSLFQRALVKSVLTFLRSNNPDIYIEELKGFLTEPGLRFHLRLMVINLLGFEDNPLPQEIEVIKPFLDTDNLMTFHFITSIQSQGWFEKLIKLKYMEKFLLNGEKNIKYVTISKLYYFSHKCIKLVLEFLDEIPSFEEKETIICNILSSLRNWENNRAVELFFEKIESLKEGYSFYDKLKEIVNYEPDKIISVFINIILKNLDIKAEEDDDDRNYISSGEIDVFIKLFEEYPNKILPGSIQIFLKIIDQAKYENEKEFFDDKAFSHYSASIAEIYRHWIFYTIFSAALKKLAIEDSDKFLELTKDMAESNSTTALNLLSECYSQEPEKYLNEGYNLIKKLSNNLHSLDKVKLLINRIYGLLEPEEKEEINNLILSVAPEWASQVSIDYLRLKLLVSIPEEEINKYPNLNSYLDTLKKKFPHINYSEEEKSKIQGGTVIAPYTDEEYNKMDLEEWEQSLLKYDDSSDDKHEFFDDHVKGGITQHAYKFYKEIAANPDKFYDLVRKVGRDRTFSIQYFDYGLRGLVEGKYDSLKIRDLVNEFNSFPDNQVKLCIIRAIEYLAGVEDQGLDLELINILENYAINDPDPLEEKWEKGYYSEDPLSDGINTVRGSATFTLGKFVHKSPFFEKIFEIFEKVAEDNSTAVKSCLAIFLQNTINLNKEKTYEIINKLLVDKSPQLTRYLIDCIYYLIKFSPNYYPELIGYYEYLFDLKGEFGKRVGKRLVLLYFDDFLGTKELLTGAAEKNENIKEGIIRVAARNISNNIPKYKEKAQEIYLEYMQDESKEIALLYDSCFYALEVEDFNNEIFKKYTESKAFDKSIHSGFFEYLLKCVNTFPEECVNFIGNLLEGTDSYNTKKAVQILIEAYNILSSEEIKKYILDIFDKVLKESSSRDSLIKMLETNDRI
jgi:hypothetical protein